MRGFSFRSHCLLLIIDNAALPYTSVLVSHFRTGGCPFFFFCYRVNYPDLPCFIHNEAESV